MNIQIRLATSKDHTFLHELHRLAYKDLVTRQFGGWDDDAQWQRFDAKLQHAAFRILELEGRPIAAIWSTEEADHIFLHELLVLPAFQSQGVGAQILRGEIDRVQAIGKPLRLHTLTRNRAQEFFKRHGFNEISRNDNYIEMERAS